MNNWPTPEARDCVLWFSTTANGFDWWVDWADGWYPSQAEGLEYAYPEGVDTDRVRRHRTVMP